MVKTKNASFPRNPTIINLFRYVKLSESAGYGIDKMLKWEKLTKQAVDFETSILYSTITYHLPKSSMKSGQKSGQKTREQILKLIKKNPSVTRMQLTEELGISSSAIQRHIKILKEMAKIRRVGPDKGGYWEIIE